MCQTNKGNKREKLDLILGFTSQIPKRLLQREIPMVPRVQFAVVDVRDLASAHIKAMTLPQAPGKLWKAVEYT